MSESRLPRISRILAGLALRFPWAVLTAAAIATVLSLGLVAARLEFRFSHTDLIADGDRYRKLEAQDRLEFEEVPDRVVVVVRADDPDRARAFAAALGGRWERDPRIERVLYRIDLAALKEKALWYLSPEDLARLHRTLAEHRERLAEMAGSRTLDDLFARINRAITTTLVGRVFTGFLDDEDAAGTPPDLTLLLSLLRELTAWVEGSRTYRSPWASALGGAPEGPPRDGYLWSDDARLLLVLADPREHPTELNRFATAISAMRADIRELQDTYPGLEVGLTGRAVIEADEMAVAQRDMTLATLVAVAGVAALLVAFLGGLVRPTFATITLLVGCAWALGVATLAVGHLNILTIVFVPMLIGLGDHSIHLLTRFEEERAAGWPLPEALSRTLAGTGMGIVVATGTTALAFATLLLTGFKGLVELGLISASGILLTALATLTVLPALLVLDARWRRPVLARRPVEAAWAVRVTRWHRRPTHILVASALLAGFAVLGLGGVRFDLNLLRLQGRGSEAVVWAQRVAEHTSRSILFDEVVVGSLGEAARARAALRARPSVAAVDSVLSVLPEEPESKRALIRELRPLVAALPVPAAAPDPVDLNALRSALERIRFKMIDGDPAAPGSVEEASRRDRREARALIDRSLAAAARVGPAAASDALAAFQAELFRDLADTVRTLRRQPDSEPVTIADLPPEIRARYVGRTGQQRLFVYPAEDVWEFEPLTRFVADVRAVTPDARGTTTSTWAYLRALRDGYTRAALYAAAGVAALAVLTFRGVGPAALALTPLALGALWTLGLMGALGLTFNAANLLFLPLVVAVGIDNGMYLVHRFREPHAGSGERVPLAPSAGKAITLASLTNMVGFGSLMVSSHHGVWSLGALVTLGVACLWIASVATLPSLLTILDQPRGALRARASSAAPRARTKGVQA
jgi:hypothetical protein